ncbi:MAG: AAA family ATPase [Candidatus Micrarchaeota archaeon]|nr:AAA family ATPase [Candidatus Micrarchaeota archaeon]
MRVICVVGLPGSGKSTAARILAEKLDACMYSTGDIIRDEIRRRGLEYTRENDEKISRWFHSGREHLIVERLFEKIKRCRKNYVVIDGLRSPSEITLLEKMLGSKIKIISVNVGFEKRLERLKKRKRFEDINENYLRERDEREKEYGVETLIKNAEYVVDNSGTVEDLEKKIEEIADFLKL